MMKKKIEQDSQKAASRTGTKSPETAASQKAAADHQAAANCDAAADRFAKDLLVRGEAAEPTQEGTLPLDATHVITGKKEDGTPEVKRVRYKAF